MSSPSNILSKSIAVLPFVNMSASGDTEYFSDGITEEIINALAKLGGLKVTSRTSSFYFKGKNMPIAEIGKKLGVSTLLEGSVRLSGNAMRITAQLIDAENDFHFWSETWDRKLDNIFDVQDEVSLLIAEKLREHFGHFEIQEHLVDKKTGSVDAYKLFLKGRHQFNKWNPDDVKQAMSYYQQALELDPEHAESMVGLADAYSFLATIAVISYEEGWGKCEELTHQALEIDSELAVAYYQLANLAFFTASDFRQSYMHVSKAIEINSNHVGSQQFMAFLCILAGQKDKAVAHLKIALSIDPLSQETQFYSSYIDYMLENYAKSITQLDVCLEANPMNIPVHWVKAQCLLKMGRYEDAIGYFDKLPSQIIVVSEQTGTKALGYALKGDETNARLYAEMLEDQANRPDGFTADSLLFTLTAATSQNDKAFDWVSNAQKTGSPMLLLRYSDPMNNPIKSDPRYVEFHDKIFPKDLFTSHPEAKQKKTLLDEKTVLIYKTRLLELIESDLVHLNPDLSLRSLAHHMEMHANQLSWLLNEGFKKNFNQFINQYRVESFKQLALDPENANLTIIAIAYDCGFNSKTVFNTYFKKETGLTPKQFLKGSA